MKYKAIIEMPKGCDKRIHIAYDGKSFINLGPIKDEISVNNGVMPVHYGYIKDTINKEEGDEVDVIVFSSLPCKTGDTIDVEIIGMLTRKDNDHKLIALDDSAKINNFDDILPEERDLILKYFGYKSEIISIEQKGKALEYLQGCLL